MIDDSKIDDFIKREKSKSRDFIKMYQEQGAEVKNAKRNFEFYFLENLNYIQIRNGYIEVDIEVKKPDKTNFTTADQIRLVSDGLAYIFQEGRICTSSLTQIENNK